MNKYISIIFDRNKIPFGETSSIYKRKSSTWKSKFYMKRIVEINVVWAENY